VVQILVLVANIHTGTMKTEVEKGSVLTVVGHGLVDPKIILMCYKVSLSNFVKRGSGQYS